jgi:D-serine dehydratase
MIEPGARRDAGSSANFPKEDQMPKGLKLGSGFDPDRIPEALAAGCPLVWPNPGRRPATASWGDLSLGDGDIEGAALRWRRYAGLLAHAFPETRAASGKIDSPLASLPEPLRRSLAGDSGCRVLVKADHMLPVTGCIKARGGIYEVLLLAERLAAEAGLIAGDSDLMVLDGDAARSLFGRHTVIVGSTGNLGFSIGVIARTLGFRCEVHMSADAKEWKKTRLRALGARVVEHAADYSAAVAAARSIAAADRQAYFVDDEESVPLFLGYAVAARDLAAQLAAAGIAVDADHPLFVHLPCGVGGAPGGITFGLKHIYGDDAVCILVEPVESPCMTLQLAAGLDRSVSVYDIGLGNRTEADGLAVARASMFVARMVAGLVDACVTVDDASLFEWTYRTWGQGGFRLEPSAAAGFPSVSALIAYSADPTAAGTALARAGEDSATHVVWTTGGQLLPDDEFEKALSRGKEALA